MAFVNARTFVNARDSNTNDFSLEKIYYHCDTINRYISSSQTRLKLTVAVSRNILLKHIQNHNICRYVRLGAKHLTGFSVTSS